MRVLICGCGGELRSCGENNYVIEDLEDKTIATKDWFCSRCQKRATEKREYPKVEDIQIILEREPVKDPFSQKYCPDCGGVMDRMLTTTTEDAKIVSNAVWRCYNCNKEMQIEQIVVSSEDAADMQAILDCLKDVGDTDE